MSEIVLREERPAASVFDLDPTDFERQVGLRETNRQTLLEWIRKSLVDGTPRCYPEAPQPRRRKDGSQWRDNPRYDPGLHAMQPTADYGRVWTQGGWSKPGLFKAGAEKIWGRLGVVPHWPALTEYEKAAVEGRNVQHIVLRCVLIDSQGRVQSEGCGARSLAQDNGDLNKAIKMAKKSAAIDAVLSFGGLSEIFTQDVDEMDESAPLTVKASPSKPKATDEGEAEQPADVPAYLQKIGFGKYGEYTWQNLVEGGSDLHAAIGSKSKAWCRTPAEVGGGRYSWIEYMINRIDGAESPSPLDKQRLEYLRKCKQIIDKKADAQEEQLHL